MSLYRNFTAAELACRCGCGLGEADMNPETMARLVLLREAVGFPLPVTSAIRCFEHNEKIGGKGPHLTGQAVDIAVYGDQALEVLACARWLNFRGIGINQKGLRAKRFIHLDDLEGDEFMPRPWVWSY